MKRTILTVVLAAAVAVVVNVPDLFPSADGGLRTVQGFRSAWAQVAVCGNGTVEGAEECDDGNTLGGDCCSARCTIEGNGSRCDDGLFCTLIDTCRDGECVGRDTPCVDDGIACTVTTCDEAAGACLHQPDHTLCDDGVFCNGVELCSPAAGGCTPALEPVECAQLDTECGWGRCDEGARACVTVPTANPECDRDGDGVSAEEDPCPHTPAGARPLVSGCAAVDLVGNPGVIVDPALAAIRNAADALRSDAHLARSGRTLDRAHARMELATRDVRLGKVCKAAKAYHKTLKKLERAQRKLAKVAGKFTDALRRSELPREVSDTLGDVTGFDVQVALLTLRQDLVARAVDMAGQVMTDADALCAAVAGKTKAEGIVAAIDDTAGLLALDTGAIFALAPKRAKRQIAVGVRVKLRGVLFADGTGVAQDIAATGSSKPPNLGVSPFACLDLRIVPVQPWLLVPVSSMTTHPLGGYTDGTGRLLLEEGMWLAAEPKTCFDTIPNAEGDYKRYSFRLELEYTSSLGGKHKKDKWTAHDLVPGELAPLPLNVDHGIDAVLTVTSRKQHCNTLTANPCVGAFEDASTTSFVTRIAARGSYCTAIYDKTDFALEDVAFTIGQFTPFPQFRPAKVVDLSFNLGFDTFSDPVFQAEGYKIVGSTSTYPAAGTIGLGDRFAIYRDHDFFSPGKLLSAAFTGVHKRSGLKWPRVLGTRNGQPLQYACALPNIKRDLLDSCTPGLNSYYRLPFYPTFVPPWTLGHANFDDPLCGHCQDPCGVIPPFPACLQRYAFDFGAPELTEIRAVRGGVVTLKKESAVFNQWTCYQLLHTCYEANEISNAQCESLFQCDNGNYVFIRHEDGTYGVYWHFHFDSVTVEVGDKVRRGEVIGLVGNTGNSSDPHLHFHVQPCNEIDGCSSIQIRFQTADDACVIPLAAPFGDPLLLPSNNCSVPASSRPCPGG